jgi:aspartokinase-like uncharacterized kinase
VSKPSLAVVKVGGSLYDLPDLGPRLRRWLATLDWPNVLLVPGGGPAADVARDLDGSHGLGEAVAHDLALRALTLNAHFLAALLSAPVCNPPVEPLPIGISILDAHAFCAADAGPGSLPECWDVTSDSVAARVAVVLDAGELVLLKSVDFPETCDWEEAGRRGLVDPLFARIVAGEETGCSVPCIHVVNLRGWLLV